MRKCPSCAEKQWIHIADREGGGVTKSKNFVDVIYGSTLTGLHSTTLTQSQLSRSLTFGPLAFPSVVVEGVPPDVDLIEVRSSSIFDQIPNCCVDSSKRYPRKLGYKK